MDTTKLAAAAARLEAAKAEYDQVKAALDAAAPTDVTARDAAANALSIARTGVDLEPGATTSEMKLAKATIAGMIALVSVFGVAMPPEKIEALVKLVEPLSLLLAVVLPAIYGFRVARKNAVDRINTAARPRP